MASDLTTGVFFYLRVLDEKPLALFRLDVDTDRKEINETVWDGSSWQETNRLTMYIGYGSTEVEQVLERDATLAFPDAFRDKAPNFKRIIPSVMSKHLQHDQKTHGRGGGRASTLNPDNHLSAPFGAQIGDDGIFVVDEDGMVGFLEEQTSAYENVTKAEGESVIAYQSAMYYEQINGGLRQEMAMGETDMLDDETRKIIDDVDFAIDKSGFSEDIVVFRGLDDEQGMIYDMKVGDSFTDAGFQSTTLNPIVATSFAMGDTFSGNPVILRIKVPAESPALAADMASNRAVGQKLQPNSEDASMVGFSIGAEVILPRMTMYEVTGTSIVDGVSLLDVTVVRND
jgi:hypothetical protein